MGAQANSRPVGLTQEVGLVSRKRRIFPLYWLRTRHEARAAALATARLDFYLLFYINMLTYIFDFG
jgi:hypothetical protein